MRGEIPQMVETREIPKHFVAVIADDELGFAQETGFGLKEACQITDFQPDIVLFPRKAEDIFFVCIKWKK